jgi:RNA polymerase sigma-70 factor, ECF subfamily
MPIAMAENRPPPTGRLRLVHRANANEPGDTELCRAFMAGDEAAFGELIRRHQDLVFEIVRRYTTRADDARDLSQRAFLKAFQAARRTLRRLAGGGHVPFRAWLLRIVINLGKNHARQERRWQRAPVDALEKSTAIAPSALETLELSERERLTRAAVLKLPPGQREVLTLRIDGELPFAEIAEVLGISENNAKVHFHHAVKRLRVLVTQSASEESS